MTDQLIHAQDFPYDFQWVNTHQPLSLYDDLQGYVLLVHFFTSTNVHCHHVFSTLAYLEQRFAERSFLVVGVHTGKFTGERDHDHVVRCVRRFGLRHPVVVDEAGEIWKTYEARAWPFLVLIDAFEQLRFAGAGEPDRDRMADAIGVLLDEAAAEGQEPYSRIRLEENDAPVGLGGLSYPTAVCFDDDRNWLWIADSSHHRIVAVDPSTGATAKVVGCGEPGAADGGFAVASFFLPQDVLVADGALYVADAGNHLIRRVDLQEERVDTVLGTINPVVDHEGGGSGSEQPINSPWGLAYRDGSLFVSMAGMHQIWRVDLATMTAAAFAGNDTRGLFDGPIRDASLCQPAGLALREDRLAFVDCDSSSLRVIDLQTEEVATWIRGGIYEWGDCDGDAPQLQYPRAVAWHGDDLILADTLNDKIRRYRNGNVETLAHDVLRPEGLAVHGDRLYVADTGNHRILVCDLTGSATRSESGSHEVLMITGLADAPTAFATGYVRGAAVRLPPMGEASLRFAMDLPAGVRLQPDARVELEAENLEGHPLLVDVTIQPDVEDGWFVARGIATGEAGEGAIRLRLVYATCHAPGQVCHVHERRVDLPVTVTAGAAAMADVVLG